MHIKDLIDKSQVNCDNVTQMAQRAEKLASVLLDWYPPPADAGIAANPAGVVPQLNTIQNDLSSSVERLDHALTAIGDCLLGESRPEAQLGAPRATFKRPPEPTLTLEELRDSETKRMAQKFAPAGAINAKHG